MWADKPTKPGLHWRLSNGTVEPVEVHEYFNGFYCRKIGWGNNLLLKEGDRWAPIAPLPTCMVCRQPAPPPQEDDVPPCSERCGYSWLNGD